MHPEVSVRLCGCVKDVLSNVRGLMRLHCFWKRFYMLTKRASSKIEWFECTLQRRGVDENMIVVEVGSRYGGEYCTIVGSK